MELPKILNGPTIMAAEKIADAILGIQPLSSSNINVWIDPDWQYSQRQRKVKRPLNSS